MKKSKRYIQSAISFLLTIMLLITFLPVDTAKASSKKYLVLVGQANGTYVAYDNIATLTAGKYLMVKAKNLANAIDGLTYKNGNGLYKGCSLSLGNNKNVYTRNLRTYYHFNNNVMTRKVAAYKQSVHKSTNTVHYATLETLLNVKYYKTSNSSEYKNLGYSGVIVFNSHSTITQLPDAKLVVDRNGKSIVNPTPTPRPTPSITPTPTLTPGNNLSRESVTVQANVSRSAFSNSNLIHVDASYARRTQIGELTLDLTTVQRAYRDYGLPADGIYGIGKSDSPVTIQGVDTFGNVITETRYSSGQFTLNVPGAVRLKVIGNQRELSFEFIPVRPTLITDTTQMNINQLSWLYPTDGFARQYFILGEYMAPQPIGIAESFYKPGVTLGNTTYQVYMVALKRTSAEISSTTETLGFKKLLPLVNHNQLTIYDSNKNNWANNYESEAIRMLNAMKSLGSNKYLPSKAFDTKLSIGVLGNTSYNTKDFILLYPFDMDLNETRDYYNLLQNMYVFYDKQQQNYGLSVPAWQGGAYTTMSKKVLSHLNISDNNYFQINFGSTVNLSDTDKNNFENYYFNAPNDVAIKIGYQFTSFIQKYYGDDVVYRILDNVYKANISDQRNANNDKLFADCIKAATSNNVFQLFVETGLNK